MSPITLAVLVALGLGLVCAVNKSLWLDEFHSLVHARATNLGSFFETLRLDNHPPLYFLLLGVVIEVLGESELAVRAVSLVCGVATVVVLGRMAHRLQGTWAPLLAPLLLACSSLHLAVSSEARMYSLLALTATGLFACLVDALEGRPRPKATGVWIFLGLHAHYYFLYTLVAASLVGVALSWRDPVRRRGLARMVPAVLVAILACLPWYLWGFRDQFLVQAVAPGANRASLGHLPESILHLLFYNLKLAGGWRPLFLAGAALAGLLALAGLVRNLSDARTRTIALCAAALGLGIPVLATLVAVVFPRAGFNWVYLSGSAPAFCLLVALQPRRSLASKALVFVVPAALALSVVNALSRGTEDYRGAVGTMLAAARERDAVIAISPGPPFFPPALGWSYYAARLVARGDRLPPRIELSDDHRLKSSEDLNSYERVLLLERGLDNRFPTLVALRARFPREQVQRFGYGLFVHTFSAALRE